MTSPSKYVNMFIFIVFTSGSLITFKWFFYRQSDDSKTAMPASLQQLKNSLRYKFDVQAIFLKTISRFSAHTLDTCLQTPESKTFCPIKKPPSPNASCPISYGFTVKQLTDYLIQRQPHVPLFSDKLFLYDFEERLMAFPQMYDIREAPSLTLSKLVPLGKVLLNGSIQCSEGELVKVRADLYDGFGKMRSQGYDDVRAWMTELTTPAAKAAANVVDLKNGSYEITLRCLWPGNRSRLYVSVAYPREYLRRVLLERRLGFARWISGTFKKGSDRETTPCFATPNLPWPCLCNFSKMNDASFYCGRPQHPRLTCSDLSGFNNLGCTNTDPVGATKAELKLMAEMARSPGMSTIKQSLFIETHKEGQFPDLGACKGKSPNMTWFSQSPTGYFDRKFEWQSLVCRNGFLSDSKIRNCLSNSHIHLFGDSNVLAIMNVFQGLMNPVQCSSVSRKGDPWCVGKDCRNSKLGFNMSFRAHEFHLYITSSFVPISTNGGVPQHIDAIPSNGKQIVIVHYYFHPITAHLSVLHTRLIALRAAFLRLLARNPDAKVGFRGPHTTTKEWVTCHITGGDTQAIYYLDIIRDVFKEVQDKVYFLDGWDMSIAVENQDFHPTDRVQQQMVRLFLSFICD